MISKQNSILSTQNSELRTQNSGLRVLIVCSKNSGKVAPFISDQVEALSANGIKCAYFTIEGKGIKGYLSNRRLLLQKIKSFQPHLIHAHYGLSGLLANLQRRVPVVTTYHGSDINNNKVFLFSRLAMLLSAFNIFVSEKNQRKANLKQKQALIPCGVDLTVFKPMDKALARQQMGFSPHEQLVLFAGHFGNAVKNPELAQAAVALLPEVRLLELKGYSRSEVATLMNAVDVCLMTSRTEGSPQFVKEALACNCPVVSVAVGDVPEVIGNIDGCYLVERSATAVSEALKRVLSQAGRLNAQIELIKKGFDQIHVVQQLSTVYQSIVGSGLV